MKLEHMNELERATRICRASKFARLSSHPIKMILPRILEATRLTRRYQVRTFFGAEMTVILPEVVSTFIYRYNYYEEDLTRTLLHLLKPGENFFDVGAHFGYASLLAAELVGPHGKVVAFEPTPRTRMVLTENLRNYACARVEPFAGWDHEDEIEMQDFGLFRSAWNSFTMPRAPGTQSHKFRNVTRYRAKTTSIDSYVEKSGVSPSFIKIDAESAESAILNGSRNTLRSSKPIISLEVGDYDIPDVPRSRELISYMLDEGYSPFEMLNGEFVRHTLRTKYNYQNITFIHETASQSGLHPVFKTPS